MGGTIALFTLVTLVAAGVAARRLARRAGYAEITRGHREA